MIHLALYPAEILYLYTDYEKISVLSVQNIFHIHPQSLHIPSSPLIPKRKLYSSETSFLHIYPNIFYIRSKNPQTEKLNDLI